MLALSRPEKALQWLLFHLLRYTFCGICGNELEGMALIVREQKSLFPRWPALRHLFALTYTGVATLRRDILVVVCPFTTHTLPLGVLAWETFWENYSAPPRVASEKRAHQTQVLVVWNYISLGCYQVYPFCISTPPQW